VTENKALLVFGGGVIAALTLIVVTGVVARSESIGAVSESTETKEARRDRGARGISERDAAGQRCVDQGDVPVMGFGFAVVCIDGAAVVEYTKPDYGDER
jgi:hypothetical protein